MTTRLYLDIDGAVTFGGPPNLFTHELRPETIPIEFEHGIAVVRTDPWRLRTIVAQFDELVWTTTWVFHGEPLTRLQERLGITDGVLAPLHTPTYIQEHEKGLSGKLHGVQRHLADNPVDRWIWIDDELTPAEAVWATDNGGLAIRTSYETGGLFAYETNIADYLEVK